jgi:hypothetical protein
MHATLHFVWTLQLCTPPCKDGGEITIPQARQTYFSVWFTLIKLLSRMCSIMRISPSATSMHTRTPHPAAPCAATMQRRSLLPAAAALHSPTTAPAAAQASATQTPRHNPPPPYLLGLCGSLRGPWRRPRPPARRVRQRQRQRRWSRACEAGMVSVRGGGKRAPAGGVVHVIFATIRRRQASVALRNIAAAAADSLWGQRRLWRGRGHHHVIHPLTRVRSLVVKWLQQ